MTDGCDPLDRLPDICPTQEQIFEQICAVLPRGRAWQTHNLDVPRELSVMQRFWWAVAGFLEWVNAIICLAINEFFCDTVDQMTDIALLEYGIPDECGLYTDLCTKIQSIPEDGCAYYQAIAAAMGYQITCTDTRLQECDDCETMAFGLLSIGHSGFCSKGNGFLRIDYCPDDLPQPVCSGLMIFGETAVGCDSACIEVQLPENLACALELVVPAHVQIQTIN